jgi:hypothetical protein
MQVIDCALSLAEVKIPKQKFKRPALPNDIIKLIRKKRRLWLKLRRPLGCKTAEDQIKLNYKVICRQIKLRIRLHKRSHLHELSKSINQRKFFGYINRVLNPTYKTMQLLDNSGNETTSDEQVASLFNIAFAKNYIVTKMKHESNMTTTAFSNTDESFRINISYEDLLRNLRAIPSSAAGPDGLTGEMIKCLAPLIARPLLIIFQQSVGQCAFPAAWKCAQAVPIFKGKGSRSDPNNYRACSQLVQCFWEVPRKNSKRSID